VESVHQTRARLEERRHGAARDVDARRRTRRRRDGDGDVDRTPTKLATRNALGGGGTDDER
jgi:hypothetical protein